MSKTNSPLIIVLYVHPLTTKNITFYITKYLLIQIQQNKEAEG